MFARFKLAGLILAVVATLLVLSSVFASTQSPDYDPNRV